MKSTDAELVNRCLAGETDAFSELVLRYQGAVYGTAYNIAGNFEDAKDLAQEAFLRAYMRLSELRQPEKYASWLRRITVSVCLNWLEAQHETVSLEAMQESESNHVELIDSTPLPSEQVEAVELREAVQEAIRALPEKYRLPLVLVYLDGLTYQDVARFLEVPLSTVKWRIHHARQLLKEEMSEMVEQDFEKAKLPAQFAQEVQQAQRKLEECMERMKIIGNALKAYEEQKGDLPSWLSDLVPDYLNAPELLICPARSGGKADVKLPCSYGYTFRETLNPFSDNQRE